MRARDDNISEQRGKGVEGIWREETRISASSDTSFKKENS